MTKTDWTAEEVRAIGAWCQENSSGIYRNSAIAAHMLAHLAERIAADESAVPVGLLTIELDRWYVEGIRMEVEAMKVPAGVYPLFTHPPAQPAQVDKCCCGEPSALGVQHRLDGPCYLSDGDGTPAQEQPGWKVPDYLIDWLKEKATHAPAPMVLCAPTMAMGDG